MKHTSNVLGVTYSIKQSTQAIDKKLTDCDAYIDTTTKTIVLDKFNVVENDTVKNIEAYKRQVLRHELIHALLFESGLHSNSTDSWAINEEIVDWIAIQFPKMQKIFKKAKCAK